jgi:hypothetical protein
MTMALFIWFRDMLYDALGIVTPSQRAGFGRRGARR